MTMTASASLPAAAAPAPADGAGAGYPRTLARLVQGRNINPQTLLATDYLNHFNDISMLLELVPEMPECLEDVRDWRPKTYVEHFRDSGFSDKELAIFAYENCPDCYRLPFEDTVTRMNALVESGRDRLEAAAATGDAANLAAAAAALSEGLRRLMDTASAIIHGFQATIDQAEVDRIMGI